MVQRLHIHTKPTINKQLNALKRQIVLTALLILGACFYVLLVCSLRCTICHGFKNRIKEEITNEAATKQSQTRQHRLKSEKMYFHIFYMRTCAMCIWMIFSSIDCWYSWCWLCHYHSKAFFTFKPDRIVRISVQSSIILSLSQLLSRHKYKFILFCLRSCQFKSCSFAG